MSAMTKTLANADELRAHLDELNDSGRDFQVAGVTSAGAPFLACLAGPYAENVVVVLGNPWDPEVEYGTGYHCDECAAQELGTTEKLSFPVVVLVTEAAS